MRSVELIGVAVVAAGMSTCLSLGRARFALAPGAPGEVWVALIVFTGLLFMAWAWGDDPAETVAEAEQRPWYEHESICRGL